MQTTRPTPAFPPAANRLDVATANVARLKVSVADSGLDPLVPLTVATTGGALDLRLATAVGAQQWTVSIDGGEPIPVTTDATGLLLRVPAGTHKLVISPARPAAA